MAEVVYSPTESTPPTRWERRGPEIVRIERGGSLPVYRIGGRRDPVHVTARCGDGMWRHYRTFRGPRSFAHASAHLDALCARLNAPET